MTQVRESSHIKAQRKGKERDNYVCQNCGSTIEVQGHHIIDYQYGGSDSVDNIVTLCRECHKKAHHGRMDLYLL